MTAATIINKNGINFTYENVSFHASVMAQAGVEERRKFIKEQKGKELPSGLPNEPKGEG